MDKLDEAQRLEHENRESALQASYWRPTEPVLEVDGVRVCKSCLEAIDRKRLEIVPTAVRCKHCQNDYEKRNGL